MYLDYDPVVFLHAEALMFVASLHHLEDHDDPAGVVASYLDAMAPNADRVMAYGGIAAL